MQINKKQLEQAAEEEIISFEQVEKLYLFFQRQNQSVAHFSFTHVLYYLGGMIAIAAMTLFMSLSWESFGGLGILTICLTYALIGFSVMGRLEQKGLLIPAGLCASFIVSLSPLLVFGTLQYLELWPKEQPYWRPLELQNWHWLMMECTTVLVGTVMVWRYKYPFILMPIAVGFWFVGNDILSMVFNIDNERHFSFVSSIYTGLIMIAVAIGLDLRSKQNVDYGFWFYLFGVLAFWLGLSLQVSELELAKFGYFCINILLILAGLVLTRRVFVVFGALGVSFYLAHLAFDVFEGSWAMPFALTAIGALVIYAGIYWQKHERRLTKAIRAKLPLLLRELLARND